MWARWRAASFYSYIAIWSQKRTTICADFAICGKKQAADGGPPGLLWQLVGNEKIDRRFRSDTITFGRCPQNQAMAAQTSHADSAHECDAGLQRPGPAG